MNVSEYGSTLTEVKTGSNKKEIVLILNGGSGNSISVEKRHVNSDVLLGAIGQHVRVLKNDYQQTVAIKIGKRFLFKYPALVAAPSKGRI